MIEKINEGKKVFDIEIEALTKMRDALDDTFIRIIDAIKTCRGNFIVTGMGKPGHIATKIAATMSSLGTPTFFLHPGEAMHGDLGMIGSNDVIMAISYSGESDEFIKILPNIKMIGAKLIVLTGNKESTLAQAADIVQVFPDFEEACALGLAPTSSTTVELCYGDALAVVMSEINNFRDNNYAMYHPAGALGKKLILKVENLMIHGNANGLVPDGASLKEGIIELSRSGLGIIEIVDDERHLKGIITDGDLRRALEKGVNIYDLTVNDIMTRHPITIPRTMLAIDALKLLRDKDINNFPVMDGNTVCGTIRWQDIINAGIVG